MKEPSVRNAALVIDDDPNLRELIGTMGTMFGVPVFEASNCLEGLRVLEQERDVIKVVLLDYYMPGMEPAPCAAAILSLAGEEIPVILVTAAVDAAARASELKLTRWLSKPFDASALEAILTQT